MVKCGVDVVDGVAGKSPALTTAGMHPALPLQVVVEFPQIGCGYLRKHFLTEMRLYMIFHIVPVTSHGTGAECDCYLIQPLIQLLRERHPTLLWQVYSLINVYTLTELGS